MADNSEIRNIYSDIAISSRVRLARNISHLPFPNRMKPGQGEDVVKKVKEALLESSESFGQSLQFMDIDKLGSVDCQTLVEKHLISPELCDGRMNAAVIIGYNEKISIMINEEDHLRIQSIYPGMELEEAWKLCNKLDCLIQEKIDLAYDAKLGYLTCCPTNVGTGIRASVMMHLPSLSITGYLKNIFEACGKLGVAIRGMYGENSEASGNIYQISNQVTLGLTEEEIIASIKSIALQIMDQERTLRQELYKKNSYRFEDMIFRSLGTLGNARILTSEESLKLLSDVRLGVDMGLIKGLKPEDLNEITVSIQPANLQKMAGRNLSHEERDVRRAEYVRNIVNGTQQRLE